MLSDLRRWFSTRRTLLRRLRYAEDGMNGQRAVAEKLREENEQMRALLAESARYMAAASEIAENGCRVDSAVVRRTLGEDYAYVCFRKDVAG